MHVLDRLLWAAVRALPAAAPAWLGDAPRGDGPTIGPEWPGRHARAAGIAIVAAPDGGLIADLDTIRGPGVDPSRVDAAVRAFFEHTGRFSLRVEPRWAAPFRWASGLWARLYARRWGQLELPAATTALTNEIYALGPAGSAGTLWVRRYPGTERALYVSRYDVVDAGEPDPCVRIVFPAPGGAWVVLFRVVASGGGLLLTEEGGAPGGPGFYFVPDRGPARYLAGLREEIEIRPDADGAVAEHHFRLWGYRFLTLAYALPRAEGAASAAIGSAK